MASTVSHMSHAAADDDAHRVGQVAVLKLVFDRQIDHSTGVHFGRRQTFARGCERLFVAIVRGLRFVGQNSVLSATMPELIASRSARIRRALASIKQGREWQPKSIAFFGRSHNDRRRKPVAPTTGAIGLCSDTMSAWCNRAFDAGVLATRGMKSP